MTPKLYEVGLLDRSRGRKFYSYKNGNPFEHRVPIGKEEIVLEVKYLFFHKRNPFSILLNWYVCSYSFVKRLYQLD